MTHTDIFELVKRSAVIGITVNEVTVSAFDYDALVERAEGASSFRLVRDGALRYNDVKINRRECKGCCIHP